MLKQISIYSISKYVELGTNAFILLHFANLVGPVVYGEAASSMLAITYSAFLVFGINGAYVKFYSMESNEVIAQQFSSFNLVYNFIMSCICYFFVLIIINVPYAYYVAGICSLNLLRGSIQSIFRASVKSKLLAVFNMTFAIFFLVIYFASIWQSQTVNNTDLFRSWCFALSISIVFGFYIIYKQNMLFSLISCELYRFIQEKFILMLKNGFYLVLLTFASIIFISSDRLMLVLLNYDSSKVGYYQYADSISNIFYMGSSSLLYLLTPIYTRKLKQACLSIDDFVDKGIRVGALWGGVVVGFVLVAYGGIHIFAPKYISAWPTVTLLSVVKYFLLLMFIPSTIFMTLHRESILIKFWYSFLPILLLFQYIVASVWVKNAIIIIPMVSFGCLATLLLLVMMHIRSNVSRYNIIVCQEN